MTKKIPLMLDGAIIEAEYDYGNPDIKITGIYIAGIRVEQGSIVDAILYDRGVDSLEDEIRDLEWGRIDCHNKAKIDEFLIDNHWPGTWEM